MRNVSEKIAITGRGMVSSLGYDVSTACAAARAGLLRTQELDYFRFRSSEDGSVESAIGHPIPELTRGFEGFARQVRITQLALGDLLKRVSVTSWSQTTIGFYLSLNDSYRVYTGLNLIPDNETRQVYENEAKEMAQNPAEEKLPLPLLQNVARLTTWPSEPLLRFATKSGHAGVAEALLAAIEDLRRGAIAAAVVGGIDTLLEEKTLEWLRVTCRLKNSGIPSGLQPGEAGAFILLETVPNVLARRGNILGIVENVFIGEETNSFFSGIPAKGDGLVKVITSQIQRNGGSSEPLWIITDQNGESYRAMEWGNAIVRLIVKFQQFGEPELWYPAASFGDTGAASGAVSMCMATLAFERGYAPTRTALLISSADGQPRAAVVLRDNLK